MGGGKIRIVKAGYYKDADISLMCHPSLPYGGHYSARAFQLFDVEYFGKSAHAVLLYC
jgi:Xaa-Arg dipeptidase